MQLTIIIPAYNEEKRILDTLKRIRDARHAGILPTSMEVLVIDDGSTDATAKVIDTFAAEKAYPIRLIRLSENQGKGAAVRAGLQAAAGDWILISDADTSTPMDEYPRLRQAGGDAAIASRGLPDSQILIRQPGFRHILGRLFNAVARRLSGLPFRDTQCGFKVLSKAAAAHAAGRLSVNNFAWDIDLLMGLCEAGFRIVEVPVRWEHRDNSRVQLWRDGPMMLWTVLRLRLRKHAPR